MVQGLLIHEVSRSHTTTHHSGYDSSGQLISPSHRPLPNSTQHSQPISMPPVGFEPTISAGERPQTYALDRSATTTDQQHSYPNKILIKSIRACNKSSGGRASPFRHTHEHTEYYFLNVSLLNQFPRYSNSVPNRKKNMVEPCSKSAPFCYCGTLDPKESEML